MYAGGGYTPVNQGLKEDTRLAQLLDTWPDLVNDISTGQEWTCLYFTILSLCHIRRGTAATHGWHEPR